MKRLLLLRHAKSSWDNPAQTDHERPLNKRGLNAAPLIGKILSEHDLIPDAIVSSTAQRARSTAEIVAETCGFDGSIVLTNDLYLAAPNAYIEIAASLPNDLATVMLVGHNPGIEALASELGQQYIGMTTANLAVFDVQIEAWNELRIDSPGKLIDIWRPKELD